jgi:hypothetical protein
VFAAGADYAGAIRGIREQALQGQARRAAAQVQP